MENLSIKLESGTLNLNIKQSDYALNDLCGFAVRQNPKRGFLFVSKVLGKHYPVKPHNMRAIYKNLSSKIAPILTKGDNTLFLGFAETATGLGAGVFEEWKKETHDETSLYLQTTRYFFEQEALLNFQEEHSHATGHLLYANNSNEVFHQLKNLILIDDELTTGKTCINFLNAFIQRFSCPLEKVIIVSIKNWMNQENILKYQEQFPFKIEFISTLKGDFEFIKDDLFNIYQSPKLDGNSNFKDNIIKNNPLRFGFDGHNNLNFEKIITEQNISLDKKTLVLGTGEFSYFPFLLAEFLEQKKVNVFYQSTTRSPILLAHDIKYKIVFKDNYKDGIENYIYNVAPEQYEQVIICYETEDKFDCSLDEILKAKNIFMGNYL